MNRKRITSILKWTGILIVALAVIYAVLLIWSTVRLRQAYAALAKAGRPMRMEDISPAKVPDAENAALLYEIAILRLRAERGGETNPLEREGKLSWDLLGGSLDPNGQEELARLLQATCIEQALTAVEEGTQRPRCRFDIDYDKGQGTRLPPLSWFQNTTTILCAKAYMQANQGNPVNAWKTVETSLRLAQALRSEPILLSQNARMGLGRRTIATLQRLCQISPPDLQQMARLDSLVKPFDDDGPWIAALDGERLLGEWVFLQTSLRSRLSWAVSLDDCGDLRGVIQSYVRAIPVLFKATLQLDHAAYLGWMQRDTEVAMSPYSRQDGEIEEQWINGLPWYCPLTRNLRPCFSAYKSNWVRAKAEARITRVGLAALGYRHAHGSFPENLDALGMKDLGDPFSGKPLIYRPEGEGFVVYSVGPDQKDDNGMPRPTDSRDPRHGQGWDIVWRYPGPKAGV